MASNEHFLSIVTFPKGKGTVVGRRMVGGELHYIILPAVGDDLMIVREDDAVTVGVASVVLPA